VKGLVLSPGFILQYIFAGLGTKVEGLRFTAQGIKFKGQRKGFRV